MHGDRFRTLLIRAPGDLASNPVIVITTSLEKATKIFSGPVFAPGPDMILYNRLAARKRSQRTFRRTKKADDKWAPKRATSKLRRHAKRLRREQWKSFCSSVSPWNRTRSIWKVIDTMNGERKTRFSFRCIALAHDR